MGDLFFADDAGSLMTNQGRKWYVKLSPRRRARYNQM